MTAIQPTPEQAQAFLSRDQDQPIVMVNLLKFKEKATYAPDRPEAAENLSGAEAYQRYGIAVQKILADIGARPLFAGTAPHYMIGGGHDWDMVALVRYPSRATMMAMGTSDAYQAIHYHREAGLAFQDLIEVTAVPGPADAAET
ncbi:MAG: DUF1330 domain-containing protein [Pseudomonadota bacterium]